MKSIVGIFKSQDAARRAAEQLIKVKMPGEEIKLLTPQDAQIALENALPTDDAETAGVGRALGAVVGGAIGLAAAAQIGVYFLATYIFSNIAAPMIAFAIVAIGVLGAWAGYRIIARLEDASVTGLPHDYLFLYKDALRQNNSLVMATTRWQDRLDFIRDTLDQMGAFSLDAAREEWWIGLRSAESEHYQNNESAYRLGFETAQNPDFHALDYKEVSFLLSERYGNIASDDEFIRGYQRGLLYARQQQTPKAA